MADIGGVWRTVGGRRIFIKDGEDLETAMKKSGKFGKKEDNSQELNKKIQDIRKSKKENLIVTDENGNIIHEELGNKYHTGYDDFDYKGTITYHNHPEGVAPYPSDQDFKTLEKTGMKKMVVVSKDYTYSYELDEEYVGYGRQGLSSFVERNKYETNSQLRKINEETVAKYNNGEYKDKNEYVTDTKEKQRNYVNEKYQEWAKNSGYKLTIEKIKK
jgi:hypothetical protein